MRTRFCATMRSPACSIIALMAPVRLRAVASGLMIENVRSIAIKPVLEGKEGVSGSRAYTGGAPSGQGCRWVSAGRDAGSELLHPRPHLDLPAPRALRLAQQMHVAFRDRVGIEQARRLVGRLGPAVGPDAAIDHHVGDVNALRRELARHALREP